MWATDDSAAEPGWVDRKAAAISDEYARAVWLTRVMRGQIEPDGGPVDSPPAVSDRLRAAELLEGLDCAR